MGQSLWSSDSTKTTVSSHHTNTDNKDNKHDHKNGDDTTIILLAKLAADVTHRLLESETIAKQKQTQTRNYNKNQFIEHAMYMWPISSQKEYLHVAHYMTAWIHKKQEYSNKKASSIKKEHSNVCLHKICGSWRTDHLAKQLAIPNQLRVLMEMVSLLLDRSPMLPDPVLQSYLYFEKETKNKLFLQIGYDQETSELFLLLMKNKTNHAHTNPYPVPAPVPVPKSVSDPVLHVM